MYGYDALSEHVCMYCMQCAWVIYGWRCCSWQLHDIVFSSSF